MEEEVWSLESELGFDPSNPKCQPFNCWRQLIVPKYSLPLSSFENRGVGLISLQVETVFPRLFELVVGK